MDKLERRERELGLLRSDLEEAIQTGVGDHIALLARVQGLARGFTLPQPLAACTRCGRHAALYSLSRDKYTGKPGYYCGPCGRQVTLFVMPVRSDDPRQLVADFAGKKMGLWLDGLDPLVWDGDNS